MQKNLTAAVVALLSMGLSAAFATEPTAIVVTRGDSQASEAGSEQNFTGSVQVDSRFKAPAPARVSGGIVTFEPGARTNWYTHPLGQTLIVTAGVGQVQKWGEPVQEIRPGDVVWIPPGVKHWHGASPTTGMTHVAISEQLDGKSVDWLEKVSDAQFDSPTSDTKQTAVPSDGSVAAKNPSAPQPAKQTRAQALMGDITPKLAELTDDVLFGDVWERPGLSKRDRSLVTVSALIAMNRPEQLRSHLALARTNGVKHEELTEAITHLAFYAGWPSAITAAGVAKEVLTVQPTTTVTPQTAPLIIQEQGSFAVGGTVSRQPGTYNNNQPTAEGQSFHGDHLYASYQTPVNSKPLPIVMLHGAYQSGRSWETTSDGREGFRDLFLRRGFPVYLVDQPRRGRAGNSTVAATIDPTPYDQLFFDQFRIGTWPGYFDGVQFDRKPETLNQFLRSITPNTGPYDVGVISDAMSALFDKTGPGILLTHSQGGGPGWLTAIKNRNVKAIVAFEPGSGFVFPKGELPAAMPSAAGTLTPEAVSSEDFKALTRIPILIYYGDNIPTEPTERRGEDNWRVRLAMAKLWVAAVNKHGGDARLVHLPEIGIRGNTHFLFSDLNNVEIADQVSKFLSEKKLDE